MKTGVIGCGNMATAIIGGLIAGGFAAREDRSPAKVSTSTKTHRIGLMEISAVWTAPICVDSRTMEPSSVRKAW